MTDPVPVLVIATLVVIGVASLCFRKWYTTLLSGLVTVAVLLGISYGSGWPTNVPFPDHAIIYGLTSDHVWAGTKSNPMPRAYQFRAPPEWFEERDRSRGQPFEVQRQGGQRLQPQGRPSDRHYEDEAGWMIVPHVLPPKSE